jgi:hypothetical protein
MRQWHIDPAFMCAQHLLGEHVEHHMFIGALKKHKNITGYLKNNLLEPKSLVNRHNAIAQEMLNRGYKHLSPIDTPDLSCLSDEERNIEIDKGLAKTELFTRCEKCKQRFLAFGG